LEYYLKERLGTLLQMPPDQIDPDVNLIRMGLDSLMFLDFSHQLSSELGMQITAETAFSADTITKLAVHIDAHMLPCTETGGNKAAQDIETYLCEQIAELLRIPVAELKTDRNLIQLGLDSLMFLDLAHTVSRDLGVTVSAEAAFELSSIADMADHIRSLREPDGGFKATGKPGELIKVALPTGYRAANGDIDPDAFANLLLAPLSDNAAVCRQRASVRPDGGGGLPFLYAEWDKTGFDYRRFERVWNHLVRRHDMMRTVETADGQLEVLSDVPAYHIKCLDIASSDDAAKEAALADMRQEMLRREIDAGTWPRFDIRAVLSGDALGRLHLAIDNRIADTESFQVLLREMAILMRDPDVELPGLDLRCAHYLSAVEMAVESTEARQALTIWDDALSNRSDYPALPVRDGGNTSGYPLHEIRILPFNQWCVVRDLGRKHGVTATSVVATLFGRALSEASGDDSFSIDLCYFNRLPLHAQVMNLVGDFSAMLPLELVSGHKNTICEEMVQTGERIRALRTWGDFSALSIQRHGTGLSTEPGIGFTTLLGIDADYPLSEAEDPVLGWPTFEQSGLAGLGLNLQALEHEQGLILTLDYDPARYRDDLVRSLADRLVELLDMLRDSAIWEKSFPSIGKGQAA
jgi:yersiniabactin nonribosomal peptide/polyketide synthase